MTARGAAGNERRERARAALALGPGSATALGRGPAAAAWMVPAGIALVVIACFLPTLRNDFVLWDDDLNFTDNPSYRGLSWRQLRWMFTTVHGGHYQPLSWVTLGLDYTLWGMNPTGYHLTSLLLHAVNAVLFYYIVLALRRPPRLLEKAPYAALALGAAALAFVAQQHQPAMRTLAQHGALQRTAQAAYGLSFYLWKTVAPWRLSPAYLLEGRLDPAAPRYLLSLLAVAGITALLVLIRRRWPSGLVAWVCYAAIVSPVRGFVQT